jgi:glutamyl-tRNA reductase
VLVGLNHRSAPIELRERLAFRREHLADVWLRLRKEVGLQEAAILSTCNRVEIYGGVSALDGTVQRLRQFLTDHGGVEPTVLAERLYTCAEPESVQHLFAVASGLDSRVLGESEILQQVKRAYEAAKDLGATGKVFNVLFQRALNAAKAVRTQTPIGRGCTSIGTVAVELAEKIFGSLESRTVLLIGAGKIGEVTLKRLTTRGVRHVRIMNRSPERSLSLAATYGAVPVLLEDLPGELVGADIIISSTTAPSYLLRREALLGAMAARRHRPLCIVDLGVPRNVEPAVGELENIYRFDIDDLEGLADRACHERQQALRASEAIIRCKVEQFLSWWQEEGLGCVPSPSAPAAVL